jgi:hypothetical protein
LTRSEVDDLDKRGRVILDADGCCRNLYPDKRLDEKGVYLRCGMPLVAHPKETTQGNSTHFSL